MTHLLSIEDLSATQALNLIQRAIELKHLSPTAYPRLSDYTAAALFYENSTRTLMSFNLAAQHCGLPLLPLNMQYSSEKKGETFLDTLMTLHAMNIKLFIIRHPSSELFTSLGQLPETLQLINAGDGTHEHPSQALLDMMTLYEHFPEPQTLRIAILGDVRHSRVANSFQKLCALLGIYHLTFISPPCWQSTTISPDQTTDQLAEGLKEVDVIVTLRVQQERLNEDEHYNLATYHQAYGLTQQSLALAKPNAVVLHPGPINRGIEISSDVADGPQSLILRQVENGVFMRMAILESLLSPLPD
jgi:aspartate carbamoyltransferase catalytic subunit